MNRRSFLAACGAFLVAPALLPTDEPVVHVRFDSMRSRFVFFRNERLRLRAVPRREHPLYVTLTKRE